MNFRLEDGIGPENENENMVMNWFIILLFTQNHMDSFRLRRTNLLKCSTSFSIEAGRELFMSPNKIYFKLCMLRMIKFFLLFSTHSWLHIDFFRGIPCRIKAIQHPLTMAEFMLVALIKTKILILRMQPGNFSMGIMLLNIDLNEC